MANSGPYVPLGSLVVNVADFGVVGDGVADDAPAIQAAVNATLPGGVVYFPTPSITYGIGATIVLPAGGNITLLGANGRINAVAGHMTITMLAGANLDACIAEFYWYNNNATSVSTGIQIRDLGISANQSNQTGGLGNVIAGKFWRSQIQYCGLISATSAGIYLSLITRNGTTTDTTNHCIENIFNDNSILGFDTFGIRTNGANCTDNFMIDNIISGAGGTNSTAGIRLSGNGGAGDLIAGNHFYTCTGAISSSNISLITIVDNYFETLFAPASHGVTSQINLSPIGGNIVITGNKMFQATAAVAGNTYFGILLSFLADAGGIVISDNSLNGHQGAPYGTGISLVASGHTVNATVSGNNFLPDGYATDYNFSGTTLTIDSPSAFKTGIATTATAGFDRFPSCAGTPTGTPDDLTQGIPVVLDTTNNVFYYYAGAAWNAIGGPPASPVASGLSFGPEVSFRPAGWTSESYPRQLQITSATGQPVVSGTLQMQAIYLQAGTPVGHLPFNTTTTAAVTPTHWWLGLYDNSLNQLAMTADQTTTALAANSQFSPAVATVAAGAATSFTTTYSGLYFIGIMIVAGTMPTLEGRGGAANIVSRFQTPVLSGTSDTGQTTVPAFPHTATGLTSNGIVYCGTA